MIKVVDRVLREFTLYFAESPFDFLKEADIQSLLSARLYDAIQGKTRIGRQSPNSHIEISPVKTEYTTDPEIYSKDRFDIVVLDADTALGYHEFEKKYPSAPLRNEVFWRQEASIAIEIKYCQLGEGLKGKFDGMLNDLERLRKYAVRVRSNNDFAGVAMLFIQPGDWYSLNEIDWTLSNGFSSLSQGVQGWIIGTDFGYTIKYP